MDEYLQRAFMRLEEKIDFLAKEVRDLRNLVNFGQSGRGWEWKNDPIIPVPPGPGQCPSPGCTNLENGNTPTGQCVECVERAYKVHYE